MSDPRPIEKTARPGGPAPALRALAGSVLMVAAALAVGLALQRAGVGPANVGLVFLLAVLMSAVTYGLWPGLFACVASALAYNFFFFPPLYTLSIADGRNAVTVIIFGIVALIASNLAARIRAQTVAIGERAAMMENLFLFSRKLADAFTLDDLLWATAYQFAQMLDVRVVILLPTHGRLAVRAGYPPEDRLDAAGMAAAARAWEGEETEAGAGNERRLFLPMRTGRGAIGIVAIEGDRPGALLTGESRRLFDALADQAALAIERLNLSEDIERERLTAETERLRSAMLTSVSHDLKTPLASILGSASMLKDHMDSLDAGARTELLATIYEEAERLNRFIANLLDMTRLESGAIQPKLEWIDIADVVGSALRRAGPLLVQHKVVLDLENDLPMLRLDPVLFEQAVFNLLDNAQRYSAPGTRIEIKGRRVGPRLLLQVSDEGDGIAEADLERVFDKFYRAQASDRKRAGTGLGLPICRGFIQAMGGSIVAHNRDDGAGARFTIEVPVPAEQPRERAA